MYLRGFKTRGGGEGKDTGERGGDGLVVVVVVVVVAVAARRF